MTYFKVIYKPTNKECDVYDITYDKNGYPKFLVYTGNEWQQLSAKHFKPVEFDYYTGTYYVED